MKTHTALLFDSQKFSEPIPVHVSIGPEETQAPESSTIGAPESRGLQTKFQSLVQYANKEGVSRDVWIGWVDDLKSRDMEPETMLEQLEERISFWLSDHPDKKGEA